jgi:hypothetical protein
MSALCIPPFLFQKRFGRSSLLRFYMILPCLLKVMNLSPLFIPFISFIQYHRHGTCHRSPASPLFWSTTTRSATGWDHSANWLYDRLFFNSSFLEIVVFPNRVLAMSDIEGVAVLQTISHVRHIFFQTSCAPRHGWSQELMLVH